MMGKKTEKKIKFEKEERDILSSLTDDILSSIISYLPLKEAVRTSILSRRWAHTWWGSITCLTINLDSMNCRPNPVSSESDWIENLNKWISIVDRIIGCCQGSIQDCQIECYFPRFLSPNDKRGPEILTCGVMERLELSYERWAEILTRCGIVRLVLHGKDGRNKVPSSILYCDSLRFLQLGKCQLGPKSSFNGCRNLRVLTLVNVLVRSHQINDCISRCVHLERLHLVHCYGMEDVTIHAPNLKYLYLWLSWPNTVALDIDGPNLTSMFLHVLVQVKRLCVRAPNLQSSRVNMSEHWTDEIKIILLQISSMALSVQQKMNIFELFGPSNKNILELRGRSIEFLAADHVLKCLPTPFNMVRKLSILVNLKYQRHAHVVAVLLERCPCIQELNVVLNHEDIKNGSYSEEPYPGYWDAHGPFRCLDACLEVVRVSNFRAHDYEVEFAKFIMAKAQLLKRITILQHDLCGDRETAFAEAARDLLSLEMASSYASVILEF